MKILAIDSSGMTATVAVVEDQKLIAEYSVNYKKTHSQTLLPMLDAVRNMTELDLDTIDAIAIAGGPAGEGIAPFTSPCGVCRQVMREFCEDGFRIILGDADGGLRIYTLADLLPASFG